MSDEGVAQPAAAPAQQASEVNDNVDNKPSGAPAADTKADGPKPTAEKEGSTPAETTKEEQASKPSEDSTEKAAEKPAEDSDVEMKDAPDATTAASAEDDKTEQTEASAPAADGDDAAGAATPNASKNKTPSRRKSTAGADNAKGKKLNKKGSRAAILHIDAKPGDHYFIKLKGFPQWPCVICDEDMLPHALIKTRPVSAARPDGEYREDYADGGKRAPDRSFPIMYLATNEFGWVSNKDLIDLDPATVQDLINPKMRKDLVLAHQIASEQHDLDYYKEVLQQFQEELIEKQKAAEAKAVAAATPKKAKKQSKPSAEDEDVEMEDVDDETAPTKAKKDKKRKSPDSEPPQRSESVKKPKIKLTNNATPKTANGAAPKAAKASAEPKSSKKAKKATKEADAEEKAQSPKEPEMSAEDRFERKKKEVLFLRHKLQKGLLTRDQQPKEDEMKVMSDYLVKLEQFPDLETEIIRATKINKVLKAMLKLETIPKEEEFNFKPRSQVLLDKWTKLLQADEAPTSASLEENGVNGRSSEAPAKEEVKAGVNGVKKAEDEESGATKTEIAEEAKPDESKSETKEPEKEPEEATEEKPAAEEAAKASEAVDTVA